MGGDIGRLLLDFFTDMAELSGKDPDDLDDQG